MMSHVRLVDVLILLDIIVLHRVRVDSCAAAAVLHLQLALLRRIRCLTRLVRRLILRVFVSVPPPPPFIGIVVRCST